MCKSEREKKNKDITFEHLQGVHTELGNSARELAHRCREGDTVRSQIWADRFSLAQAKHCYASVRLAYEIASQRDSSVANEIWQMAWKSASDAYFNYGNFLVDSKLLKTARVHFELAHAAARKAGDSIREGRAPHPEANMTPDYIPYFTNKVQIHPMTNNPTSKKNFVPSRHEELIVARLQKGIREGKIRIEKKKNKKSDDDDLFLLWNDDGWNGKRRRGVQFRMPKMKLPSHAESYRPPDEYLPTEEEKQALEEKEEFVPTKFDSLRKVPGYKNFLKERFERCLDLYLCPAKIRRKKKEKVEPEALVPNLPHPRELRPFPEEQMLLFKGHEGRVRSISVSPSGQWLVSCGEDRTVRIVFHCVCVCISFSLSATNIHHTQFVGSTMGNGYGTMYSCLEIRGYSRECGVESELTSSCCCSCCGRHGLYFEYGNILRSCV